MKRSKVVDNESVRYTAIGNRPVALLTTLVAVELGASALHPNPNVHGQRLLSVLLLGPVLIGGTLAMASSRIHAGREGVVAFTILGRRRWRWAEITSFTVATRSIGLLRYQRRVLGIQLKNGDTRWLTEISSRPEEAGAVSPVDMLARRLNSLLTTYVDVRTV